MKNFPGNSQNDDVRKCFFLSCCQQQQSQRMLPQRSRKKIQPNWRWLPRRRTQQSTTFQNVEVNDGLSLRTKMTRAVNHSGEDDSPRSETRLKNNINKPINLINKDVVTASRNCIFIRYYQMINNNKLIKWKTRRCLSLPIRYHQKERLSKELFTYSM